MDISIMDAFNVMGAVAVPVAGYMGYIHKKVLTVEATVAANKTAVAETYVAKPDYREDMRDIKDMLHEMRSDVKAILGVPQ